ncbi:MAG: hypothetical protein ACEQSH_00990 [Bacteroidia bacterium]
MRFWDIVMTAATQGGGAAAGPPPELFPDPTLADVADGTNGWQFSNGPPTMGPTSGTGPGISVVAGLDDDNAILIGTDDVDFAALITMGSTYAVAITFANVSVSGTLAAGPGGATANFVAANGTVTHNVVAGDPSGGNAWTMTNSTNGATYDITHISVKAA